MIRGANCFASPHIRPCLWTSGDQEDRAQEDSSTPTGMHERSPSDLESGLTEQLQAFDSFSLPPGLYAPELPGTLGAQSANQAQAIPLSQLQTQVRLNTCKPFNRDPDSLPPLQRILYPCLRTYSLAEDL